MQEQRVHKLRLDSTVKEETSRVRQLNLWNEKYFFFSLQKSCQTQKRESLRIPLTRVWMGLPLNPVQLRHKSPTTEAFTGLQTATSDSPHMQVCFPGGSSHTLPIIPWEHPHQSRQVPPSNSWHSKPSGTVSLHPRTQQTRQLSAWTGWQVGSTQPPCALMERINWVSF